MIRFCDKEVYNIIEGELTRDQMLSFFKKDEVHRYSVIAVYNNNGLQGIITYETLLEQEDIICVRREQVMLSDSFWNEAKEYFKCFPNNLLPIVDKNDFIIGFAFDDIQSYYYIEEGISQMYDEYAQTYCVEKYQRIQIIVITDLNELAWKCYWLFKKMGYEVCVIGHKWEWFGFKSCDKLLDYPEYAIFHIYAEGTDNTGMDNEDRSRGNNVVQDAFRFVQDINDEIRENIYQETIEKLIQKGVSICECIVPGKVQYKTELERKCSENKVSLEKYLDDSYNNKSSIEKYIFEMYGKESVEIIQAEGGKGRYIPVGNYVGQTVLELSNKKRIYLIGPCIADGYGCRAKDSLGAQLQKFADQYKYQVIAITIEISNWRRWRINNIETIPIRESDIILIVYDENWFPYERMSGIVPKVNLSSVYNNQNRNSMFCRMTLHTNPEGNRVIANEIYECYLKDEMIRLCQRKESFFLQKGELLSAANIADITQYTDAIYKTKEGKIGAIVMNCNPFTYGHRYLIEYAANQMDFLYVFVVEEDRSYFRFCDRYEMVQTGTEDLANVIVVPSGKWVLSYTTMPAYFKKECKQDIKVDANMDLEIFCRYVAPNLGIQKRFVGEEPFDQLTRQYNEQMREVLGEFRIEFEEVPRKAYQGQAVSASYVRKCMKEGKWDQISECVPKTSYQICLKYQKNQ